MRRTTPWALLALTLLPAPARADTLDQVPDCAGLSAADRARVERLAGAHFLYDACDDTVAACLAARPAPELARRLAGELCRRVRAGEPDDAIGIQLDLRARSMSPGGPVAAIDVSGLQPLGEAEAPAVVVAFACTRCPFCAQLLLDLEREITAGALRGQVRLFFKPFPLKGHEGSVEGGLAVLAAADQGRQWPYAHLVFERFDRFEVGALEPWAAEAGLDVDRFRAAAADPATRERLVAARREGLALDVRTTPTLFIGGRRYQGELTLAQLVDVLQEEAARAAR